MSWMWRRARENSAPRVAEIEVMQLERSCSSCCGTKSLSGWVSSVEGAERERDGRQEVDQSGRRPRRSCKLRDLLPTMSLVNSARAPRTAHELAPFDGHAARGGAHRGAYAARGRANARRRAKLAAPPAKTSARRSSPRTTSLAAWPWRLHLRHLPIRTRWRRGTPRCARARRRARARPACPA